MSEGHYARMESLCNDAMKDAKREAQRQSYADQLEAEINHSVSDLPERLRKLEMEQYS